MICEQRVSNLVFFQLKLRWVLPPSSRHVKSRIWHLCSTTVYCSSTQRENNIFLRFGLGREMQWASLSNSKINNSDFTYEVKNNFGRDDSEEVLGECINYICSVPALLNHPFTAIVLHRILRLWTLILNQYGYSYVPEGLPIWERACIL